MRRPDRSLLTGAFVALTLADLAYFAAGGALVAVTPFFVTRSLGLGEAAVGLAVGAFSVTTVVLRPLAGRWADRHGRRPLLVGGAGLFAVLAAGHLLVTDLRGLVALRLLLGAAEALFFVAGFAALADLAPPGRTGEALSYNSLALYGGIATGPVAGQALLAQGGFTAVWAGVTALLLVATLLAARVPETLPRERGPAPSAPSAAPRERVPVVHRAAVVPAVALGTGVAASAGLLAFGPLRADELDLRAWSVVPLVFGGVVVVCRVAFATLPDRVDPRRLAAAALAATALGLLLVAAARAPWTLVLGAAVLAAGAAFLTPAIFAAVFAEVPASRRGSAAGTVGVAIDLGLSGGPILLGLVAATGGIPAGFLAGAALTGLGLVLLLRSWRSPGSPPPARTRRG